MGKSVKNLQRMYAHRAANKQLDKQGITDKEERKKKKREILAQIEAGTTGHSNQHRGTGHKIRIIERFKQIRGQLGLLKVTQMPRIPRAPSFRGRLKRHKR